MLSLLLRLLLFVQLLCHFFNTLLTNAKLPETNRRKLPRRIALKSHYRQIYQVFKHTMQQWYTMIIKSSQLFHWLQLLGLPAPIFPSDRHYYYWWCTVYTHTHSVVNVRRVCKRPLLMFGRMVYLLLVQVLLILPALYVLSRTKTSIENCYYPLLLLTARSDIQQHGLN